MLTSQLIYGLYGRLNVVEYRPLLALYCSRKIKSKIKEKGKENQIKEKKRKSK